MVAISSCQCTNRSKNKARPSLAIMPYLGTSIGSGVDSGYGSTKMLRPLDLYIWQARFLMAETTLRRTDAEHD